MATLYHEQGKYDEAEDLYVEALDTVGKGHPDHATVLQNLIELRNERSMPL